MVKCPHCGKEIDYLRVTVTEETTKTYAGGNGTYDEEDKISTEMSHGRCPECDQDIALDGQDAADAFLETGVVPTKEETCKKQSRR